MAHQKEAPLEEAPAISLPISLHDGQVIGLLLRPVQIQLGIPNGERERTQQEEAHGKHTTN